MKCIISEMAYQVSAKGKAKEGKYFTYLENMYI
jgi:hypothetical protein